MTDPTASAEAQAIMQHVWRYREYPCPACCRSEHPGEQCQARAADSESQTKVKSSLTLTLEKDE